MPGRGDAEDVGIEVLFAWLADLGAAENKIRGKRHECEREIKRGKGRACLHA